MLAFQITVLVFLLVLLVVWTNRFVMLGSPRMRGPHIGKESAVEPPDPAPLVSVIVPAKDEADNIAACLDSLFAQDYPNFEVIVVDDRSSDATSEIVRSYAERHPNVKLLRVEELPPGWFGKPHALHVGAKAAGGDWLLFVDADCMQARHSILAGMGFACANGADMLSLWPVVEMPTFWANALQPVAGAMLAAWFRPTWVNNPKKKTAFANGQWILIRRSAYDAVGGHETVKDEVVEDIAFARNVKGRGFRLLTATTEDLFTTHMYAAFGEIWRGWTRIYYGAFRTFVRLLLTALVLLLVCFSPYVLLVIAGVGLASAPGGLSLATFLASAATVAMMLAAMSRLFRITRGKPKYLAFHPLSILIVVAIVFNSMLRLTGRWGVTWRGTTYKGKRVVS
ncbi:MAG: glycosyltransferase [Planctomycetia bacterium]|nr:glycosyltransferase [Planctomycetia bacterium]